MNKDAAKSLVDEVLTAWEAVYGRIDGEHRRADLVTGMAVVLRANAAKRDERLTT